MYVWMYVFMFVCLPVFLSFCMHVYVRACMCTYACMHVWGSYMYICKYTCHSRILGSYYNYHPLRELIMSMAASAYGWSHSMNPWNIFLTDADCFLSSNKIRHNKAMIIHWKFNIIMENGPFIGNWPIQIVIFHSHVSHYHRVSILDIQSLSITIIH